jgi:hypothetical protein
VCGVLKSGNPISPGCLSQQLIRMEAPPSPLSSRLSRRAVGPKWRACPERSRMGICSSLNQQLTRRKKDRRKRKGDFSCEISPFLSAFVEDLVRLPNHNAVIPKSFVSRERSPRFLHFSSITRCKSFLAAMHRLPVAWSLHGFRYRFPRWL